jgi:hypothetical protein
MDPFSVDEVVAVRMPFWLTVPPTIVMLPCGA